MGTWFNGKSLVSVELPLSQTSASPLSCDNVVSRQLMLNKGFIKANMCHDQIPAHVVLCCLPGKSSIKSNVTEANVVRLHSFNINAEAKSSIQFSELGGVINRPLNLYLGVSLETYEIRCKTTRKQAPGRATPVLTHCENCSE